MTVRSIRIVPKVRILIRRQTRRYLPAVEISPVPGKVPVENLPLFPDLTSEDIRDLERISRDIRQIPE